MRTEYRLTYLSAILGLAVWLLTPAIGLAQPRVAVMNFENNSTWRYWGDNLGAAAADELVTQLLKTGSYRMIERSQLAAAPRLSPQYRHVLLFSKFMTATRG
jgi:hypothetical protein